MCRTETSIEALRAQALGQQQGAEHSPGTKGITFCCCNDVIAPPIWTLLLVHCPSYLKQLWALNTEAKLVSLCLLAMIVGVFCVCFAYSALYNCIE